MTKKVMLDPGHGGTDPGAVGNGLQEKDLTLTIAKYTGAFLTSLYDDVSVFYTRSTDKTLTLTERSTMANSKGVDVFASIHINAGGGTGYETYIHTEKEDESVRLQKDMKTYIDQVVSKYGIKDRGLKTADHSVTRNTLAPAILTETLFIDTTSDAALLKNDQFLKDVAKAHAQGIGKFLGLKEKTTVTASNTTSQDIYKPSSQTILNSTATVLRRLEQKEDNPLSSTHREKLLKGELTISDAIGLIYVAIERGHIVGK